jgi:hypothetical protein
VLFAENYGSRGASAIVGCWKAILLLGSVGECLREGTGRGREAWRESAARERNRTRLSTAV